VRKHGKKSFINEKEKEMDKRYMENQRKWKLVLRE
jgi:hypothetical protein